MSERKLILRIIDEKKCVKIIKFKSIHNFGHEAILNCSSHY